MTSQLLHEYDAQRAPSPWLGVVTGVVAYPLLVLRHRSLVGNFVNREFQARFKGSMLGPGWVLIHPLFLFAMYWGVFGFLLQTRGPADRPQHWYTLYMFSGVLAWTAFSDAAVRSCHVILENGNLIKKVAFPSELLPLHLIAVNLLVYVTGLLAFFLFSWFLGGPLPGLNLTLLPVVLLVQLVFTLGVGLFVAAATVFLRDLMQIFPLLCQAWFFMTPVFWYPEMLGADKWTSLGPWIQLNPMYHVVAAHRAALGLDAAGIMDILGMCGRAVVPAIVTFMLGYAFFQALEHRFADEV